MKVGVVKETAPGERRVALVPETVPRLTAAGLEVLVEQGAGQDAWFPDDAYAAAGAATVSADSLYDDDMHAANTQADPQRVTLRPNESAHLEDGRLRITLPPVSWTAVSMREA